jgi:hypothetical protein
VAGPYVVDVSLIQCVRDMRKAIRIESPLLQAVCWFDRLERRMMNVASLRVQVVNARRTERFNVAALRTDTAGPHRPTFFQSLRQLGNEAASPSLSGNFILEASHGFYFHCYEPG